MEDNLNFIGNWKTTSTFRANGGRSQLFRQMEDNLIFWVKWRTTPTLANHNLTWAWHSSALACSLAFLAFKVCKKMIQSSSIRGFSNAIYTQSFQRARHLFVIRMATLICHKGCRVKPQHPRQAGEYWGSSWPQYSPTIQIGVLFPLE